MELINCYNIKYSNHLLGSESLVLRGDEGRGDSPILSIYSNDNLDLILLVDEGVFVEKMTSNPKAGAKTRFDIHIGKETLKDIIIDLNKFKIKNELIMDTKSITLHNPTGTEHSNGLPLGHTRPLTRIPAFCSIGYQDLNKIAHSTTIYIDAENYIDKQRYHIGGSTNSITSAKTNNYFKIVIPLEYVYRFIKSIELAIILLR